MEARETSLEDYEDLVQMMLQRAMQSLGPKAAKGVQVKSIITDKVTSLTDKAKAFVMTELTDGVGSVARALQMEEFMVLLDEDAALAANFPPLSVLLAGLLVPANLNVNMVCQLLQIFLVLLPVLSVAAVSEYADWDHPCKPIPGLRLWARTVGVVAALVILARLAQVIRCVMAKADIRRRNEEMQTKMAEASRKMSDTGLDELKTLFTLYAGTLQHAVEAEGRVRVNFFAHVIGFGTFVWLLTTFYNTYLYFAYMFVPGVVAFHPSQAGEESYCGAWMTVCAAKVAIILALLFFFANIVTVFCWISETALSMDGVAAKIVSHAKAFDNVGLGLPVAQLLVKALLLRGSADLACARLAVQMRDKDGLSQELAATEKRLAQLKADMEAKSQQVDALKEELKSSPGFKDAQARGAEAMAAASNKAAQLGQQTGEESANMLESLRTMMDKVA